MIVSYDVFIEAFLMKITEYDFCVLPEYDRDSIIIGFMKRACAQFDEVCLYDLSKCDDEIRTFEFPGITEIELEEIIDIVSEGMLMQWMKQHMYKQENLENTLNTADFTSYSPAELIYRITNAYKMIKRDFTLMIRDYSYRHGDLSDLHL